jgi:hypothetical protein
LADMIMPGMQYPHCSAEFSAKGFLHRVEMVSVAKAFNRKDIRAVSLYGKHEARVDRLSVHQHRAGAALPAAAAFLRPYEVEVLAKEIQ